MKIQQFFFRASVGALLAFSTLTASLQAQVIVDDSFADGDLAMTGLLDTNWWTSSSSAGIEIATGSLGLVSGTSGRGIHTVFPTQTLDDVGDKLTATYTFTTPATVGSGSGSAFRVGLFDTLGRAGLNANVETSTTPPPGPSALYGWSVGNGGPGDLGLPGYMMDMDVNTGAAADLNFREHNTGSASGRLLGTTGSGSFSSFSSGPDAGYTFDPSTTYSGSISVERISATKLRICGSIGSSFYCVVDDSFTSADFGFLGFHANSGQFGSSSVAGEADNGIDFSNVKIEFTASPPGPTTVIFDGEQSPFGASLTAFDAFQDLGDGVLDGVESLDTSVIFGTGTGMRMYDNNTGDKPELQGEVAVPLLEPFRIDIDSSNLSAVASSVRAIRFRMSNAGDLVTSQNRTAFSVSWQAGGEITASYSDGAINPPATIASAPLVGAQTTTIVANGAVAGTYAYTLFGESRTLDPLHYDLYINGVLQNSGVDPAFVNGMQFTTEYSAATYTPGDGLGQFGLFGSSNSDVDPDYAFDNIVLRTGTDIEFAPFVLGDANDDGAVNSFDIAAFGMALFDATAYALAYPDVDPDVQLDMNDDGALNSFDIPGFGSALGF